MTNKKIISLTIENTIVLLYLYKPTYIYIKIIIRKNR